MQIVKSPCSETDDQASESVHMADRLLKIHWVLMDCFLSIWLVHSEHEKRICGSDDSCNMSASIFRVSTESMV